MNGRDEHMQAVSMAIGMIQQLQSNLREDDLKHPEAMGFITNAVGEQPVSASGRAAVEAFVAATIKTDELLGLFEEVKNRLEEYGQTF